MRAGLFPALPLLLAAAFYLHGYRRVRPQRVGWPLVRVVSFLAGLAATGAALLPPLATHEEVFPVHVAQHLLLAMGAPLLFALSAPVTLALRTLPSRARRALTRILHTRAFRVLAHPLPAAVVDFAPLYLLYLTPVYGYTLAHPRLHELLHAHFFLAGCLFAWATVGVDPVPGRPSVGVRGTVIVLAFAAHGMISKLMFAAGPAAAGAHELTQQDWQLGAQLMWYGGDAVEVALVLAFALQWYRLEGRRYERARRSRESLLATQTRI